MEAVLKFGLIVAGWVVIWNQVDFTLWSKKGLLLMLGVLLIMMGTK